MKTSIKVLTIAALGVLSSGISVFAAYSSDMDQQNMNQTRQNRWNSAPTRQSDMNSSTTSNRMNTSDDKMDMSGDKGNWSEASARPDQSNMDIQNDPYMNNAPMYNGCCPRVHRCHVPCAPRCAPRCPAPCAPKCRVRCAPRCEPRCAAPCEQKCRVARPCCIVPHYYQPYGVNYYPGSGYGTQYAN